MVNSKAARGIRPNVRTFKLKQNISGMSQNRAETFLRPDQALDILNMHATEEGSWSADRAGYTVINAGGTSYESGAAIDGMAIFTDSNSDDHLFLAINGKLKEVNTGSGVASDIDAAAGYAVGGRVDFLGINDALYTVDGTIATPRKWDGASAGNSPGWPITDGLNTYDTPKLAEHHQGRAAFLNFQGFPGHFALSVVGDPEDFTTSGLGADGAFINEAGVGDGQYIVGARSIHIPASNNSQLVIFKNRSTFALTGNSALPSDADFFRTVGLNENYGAINDDVIVQVGNDLLSLNEFGITSYSTANQSGTLQPLAIESDKVTDIVSNLNANVKEKCWGIHIPHRREVWWFLPTGASTQCNEAIVYKYPSPGAQDELPKWSHRMDAGGKFKMAHGCLLDRVFYIGSYAGKVGTMFTASTYDGTGIPWRYEYPYIDVGNEKQNKRVLNCDLQFKVRSNQSITHQYLWKGGGCNDQGVNSLTVETTVSGATYGTAVYGTDYYGASEEVKVQSDVFGDGLRLKHVLSGTTTDTGPEFLGISQLVEMGNLSQHWN